MFESLISGQGRTIVVLQLTDTYPANRAKSHSKGVRGRRDHQPTVQIGVFWQINLWKICEKHLGSIKEIFLFLFWKPGCKIVLLCYSDINNIG